MEELVFLIRGPRRSARLHLEGPFFVIGRAEPFPVFHDDPTLSREHAAVVDTPAGYRLKDLGSRNGVVLNGERLERFAEVPLSRGDVFQAGDTRIHLVSVAELEAAQAQRAASEAGSETLSELSDSAESITVDAAGRTGHMPAIGAGDLDEEDDAEDAERTLELDRGALELSESGRELALPVGGGLELEDDPAEFDPDAPTLDLPADEADEVDEAADLEALVEAADALLDESGSGVRSAPPAAEEGPEADEDRDEADELSEDELDALLEADLFDDDAEDEDADEEDADEEGEGPLLA